MTGFSSTDARSRCSNRRRLGGGDRKCCGLGLPWPTCRAWRTHGASRCPRSLLYDSTSLSQTCCEVAKPVATWRTPAQGQCTMPPAVPAPGSPGEEGWRLCPSRLCLPSHPRPGCSNPQGGPFLLCLGAWILAAPVRSKGRLLLQHTGAPCPVSREKSAHKPSFSLTDLVSLPGEEETCLGTCPHSDTGSAPAPQCKS